MAAKKARSTTTKPEVLNTRLACAVFAVLFTVLAVAMMLRAIDTANLYAYALAFVAFGFAARDVYRTIRGTRHS